MAATARSLRRTCRSSVRCTRSLRAPSSGWPSGLASRWGARATGRSPSWIPSGGEPSRLAPRPAWVAVMPAVRSRPHGDHRAPGAARAARATAGRGLVSSVILGTLLWAAVGHAMHGGGGALAVVVEAESATDGTGSRGCVMTGTVLNPNIVVVTVTLLWRGADATGNTLGFASA